ncbi:hypothetical protein [Aureispira sp. CCB-QB1]|uniref:hypothetical protein n=1 Tax=Aureispira sp. CCB-QB1 TaxID=1313421 RepID=UPI000697C831|nr:hypothetical protein [Aureispira sp. CCB-QB1]
MKKILPIITIILIFLYSCKNNHSPNLNEKKNGEYHDIESIINKRIMEYTLNLKYDSSSQVKLNNDNYRTIAKWLDKFETDSILKIVPIDELEDLFIFQIEASVNQKISKHTCKERMENIQDIIDTRLGKKQFNISVYKTLKSYKPTSKDKNEIQIRINKLLL